MSKNTGVAFENRVFKIIQDLVTSNTFLVSAPNIKVHKKAKYYSRDREANIECEISVEKYLENPDLKQGLRPALIIVIECKDYSGPVSVDEVEEFHAKLQQIGPDNTKGVMITSKGTFQKSALKYASAKGIALARILPDDQVQYIMYEITAPAISNLFNTNKNAANIIRALCEKKYCSQQGESFFCFGGDYDLHGLIRRLLE
ncbi:restriction endonuclease [Ruminococcus sp. OA3]|uniref:restriction endonuclease n=1 Tax=Ruminococcus sp. OA3 TaxID=2914164 RepID=UPI001F054B61|nr:restriction endonuclease [Ruminococcus sp. OA3]MCH1981229.1 restriction endonuclease [Ruminococcus sp. OA3]